MFKGTAEKTSYQPYTGMAAFQVIAVNPSKDRIEQIIGRQYPLEVNYEQKDDINGNKVFPIEFWVFNKELGITDRVTFQIGNSDVKSQSGNYQFINDKGISRYAQSIEDANSKYEKMAPFVRTMKIGEEALYRFMHCAMSYKPSSKDANFLEDCVNAGITPDKLFAGELDGLNEFIDFVNSKSRRIGLVLGVKQKEKVLEDGNKITQNRQVILNNPDYFFTLASGRVDQYNINQLTEVVADKQKNNQSLGTALFTISLQEFKKDDCINTVPDNPVNTQQAAGGW